MFKTERLKQLRKKQRLSQASVAEDLNITRECYSMYETGSRQPSCENLVALAQYFHVSSDYLVGLSDTPLSFNNFCTRARFIILSLPYLDDIAIEYIISTIQIRCPHLKFHDTSNVQSGSISRSSSGMHHTPRPGEKPQKRFIKSYTSSRKTDKKPPYNK